MLLQRLLMALIAISFLATAGCQSLLLEHPLIAPKDAKVYANLHGMYRVQDPDNPQSQVIVHIGQAGPPFPAGMLRITSLSHMEQQGGILRVSNMMGFVEPLGKYYLLHIPIKKHDREEQPNYESWDSHWDPTEIDGYYLARLTIQDDRIDIAYMNTTFIHKAIENKSLAGTIGPIRTPPEEPALRVTADAKELRAFLETHVEGPFFLNDSKTHLKLMRFASEKN